jgi:endonuclease YncB( thermonuclease family)
VKIRKILIFIFGSATIISLIYSLLLTNKIIDLKNQQNKYKITRVIDGDTIKTKDNQTIRLANINAPEQGYCLWQESKQKLEELILNKYVTIKSAGEDDYYRLMALIYHNNQLINLIMIREGLARYQRGGVSQHAQEIKDEIKYESQKAKDKQIGIWSTKCRQTQNIQNPDCNIKGNIDKSNQEKTYHFPGCQEYDRTIVELDIGEQWFCSEQEAQNAGYTKAKHCFDKSFN